MEDPFKRGWLCFWLLIVPVVGMLTASYHVPVVSADAPRLIKPLPTPKALEASITAVYATPTPTPIPTRIALAKAPTAPPRPVVGDFESMLHAATVAAWGEGQWPAMRLLVMSESGMNPYAVNKSSGACSAFQFLPCSKLGAPMSDFGNQISKGISYVKDRYGTPSAAWAFHVSHNWY